MDRKNLTIKAKALIQEYSVLNKSTMLVVTPSELLSIELDAYNKIGALPATSDDEKAAKAGRLATAKTNINKILKAENTNIRLNLYENCNKVEYPMIALISCGTVPQIRLKFNDGLRASVEVAPNTQVKVDIAEYMQYLKTVNIKELKTADDKPVHLPVPCWETELAAFKHYISVKAAQDIAMEEKALESFKLKEEFTNMEFKYMKKNATMTSNTTLVAILQQVIEHLLGDGCLEVARVKILTSDIRFLESTIFNSSKKNQGKLILPNHKKLCMEIATVAWRTLLDTTYEVLSEDI